MSNKILITRPTTQGRELVAKLAELGIESISQPLFDYGANATTNDIKHRLDQANAPILIFVSVAAVAYADRALPIGQWPYQSIIAVGEATQTALQNRGITSICPEQHDSEGLLTLPELSNIEGQDIIIVRGDGGRELIAEQLSLRGANVNYLESYQRVWRTFANDIAQQWKNEQINCIVTTSNALLDYTLGLLGQLDSYWQETCLWVVASERIAMRAKQAGLAKVINANGASDRAIIAAISQNGTR